MGKRLIRINKQQLRSKIQDLIGLETDVIANKVAFHGNLTGFDSESLFLTDKKGHKHALAFNTIEEVIYDYQASF
jgi:hypothetical protein